MSGRGRMRWYAPTVLSVLVTLALAAACFFAPQNASARSGGEIAPQKMLWLFHAIVLWLVIPGAVVFDRRVHVRIRGAYMVLFVAMALRAVVEPWMLYVARNWSPWHGIAHDAGCVIAIAVCSVPIALSRDLAGRANAWLLGHLVVTTAAFLPEIYVAHYMLGNFNTTGEGAIYFVPNDERHGVVLGVTTVLVTFLSLYLPVFLWGWLFGSAGSKHPTRG